MESAFAKVSKVSWVLMVILLVWYVVQKAHLFGVASQLPVGLLAVFVWGMALIAGYLSKREVLVMYAWVPAGGYKDEKRLAALYIGIGNICLAIYGFLAGWTQ